MIKRALLTLTLPFVLKTTGNAGHETGTIPNVQSYYACYMDYSPFYAYSSEFINMSPRERMDFIVKYLGNTPEHAYIEQSIFEFESLIQQFLALEQRADSMINLEDLSEPEQFVIYQKENRLNKKYHKVFYQWQDLTHRQRPLFLDAKRVREKQYHQNQRIPVVPPRQRSNP